MYVMKRVYNIKEDLAVELKVKRRKTVITIIDNGVRKILADIKTNKNFYCRVRYDKNYIVAYTRGNIINKIPINVEAAYNINTRNFMGIENKRFKRLLEYMLICKKEFAFPLVLQTINDEELQIVKESEKEDLFNYLTAGSKRISRDEVIEYILSKYPVLREYTKLHGPICIIEYRKIKKEIIERTGIDCFFFNIMPIPCNNSNLNICDNTYLSDTTNYKQIYISEYEHRNM